MDDTRQESINGAAPPAGLPRPERLGDTTSNASEIISNFSTISAALRGYLVLPEWTEQSTLHPSTPTEAPDVEVTIHEGVLEPHDEDCGAALLGKQQSRGVQSDGEAGVGVEKKQGRCRRFVALSLAGAALVAMAVGVGVRHKRGGAEAKVSSSQSEGGNIGVFLDAEAGLSTSTAPTFSPTVSPSTASPTKHPTTVPPTVSPSTASPTKHPTTARPTLSPTVSPSSTSPTVHPTFLPTRSPVNIGDYRGEGEWGKTFDMELIPIHSIVLSNRKLLSYGTDTRGRQGADLYYEVWDLNKGNMDKGHKLFDHGTSADLFCSSLNIDPSTGNVIIMGGDVRRPDAGLGIKIVLEYSTERQTMRPHPKGNMHYARWYGTSVNLPNGDIFVIGGRSGDERKLGSPIPEVWSPETGFRSLKDAKVPAIAKELDKNHWWYPHTYVNSKGEIIVIMPRKNNAHVYRVGVEGNGDIEIIGKKPFEAHVRSPSIMFRIDQVMFLDDKGRLWVVDISGKSPKWSQENDIGESRINGSLSMLPDGRVAITGGAKSGDDGGSNLDNAIYTIQIWDPITNKVYTGTRQKLARLYHSHALILPDGTLEVAGGGAPGPLKNLNGQIYHPDYLFDRNQDFVARPSIVDCPRNVETNEEFVIVVNDATQVSKVTATKSGSSSHTRNCDTRWLDLKFEVENEEKRELRVFAEGKNIMIGGLWMLTVIDVYGVPSEASLLGVNMAPLDAW